MPSIAQRPNGKWRVRFRDSTGRWRARHFARRSDAERWVAGQITDVERGQWVDWRAGRVTFGAYATQWAAQQIQHRPSTVAATDSRLRNHLLPTFENRPLAAITRSEVRAWVSERSKVLAPSTLEACYRLLAQIFLAAVDDRVVATSPCRKIALPQRAPAGQVVPLTAEEVLALAGSIEPRLGAAVWLGAGVGMRLSEVLGLTVDHVDFFRKSVRIDRQLAGIDGRRPRFGPPKTKASSATVPVGQVVLDHLAAHLAAHGAGVDELVVTGPTGVPLRRNRFGEHWAAALERAGLPTGVRFHDLRHFYASALIRGGMSPKAVQARLRHATIGETFDTYGHLWPDDEERTREAIDNALLITGQTGTRARSS